MIGFRKNKKRQSKERQSKERQTEYSPAFSLIEVIISVAIFSVIMLSMTEIFSLVINGQRDAIASQNVQESLKYFLEVTAKEMRMARKNEGNVCPDIPPGQIFLLQETATGDVLKFKNYSGECVTYYTAASVDLNSHRFKISRDFVNFDFISPLQIDIRRLDFILNDASSSQPMVTMNIEAQALSSRQFTSNMTLQTSVSSRYYK